MRGTWASEASRRRAPPGVDAEAPPAAEGEAVGDLEQQRGLADPRLPGEQDHLPGDEPAPDDAVELAEPGGGPGGADLVDLVQPPGGPGAPVALRARGPAASASPAGTCSTVPQPWHCAAAARPARVLRPARRARVHGTSGAGGGHGTTLRTARTQPRAPRRGRARAAAQSASRVAVRMIAPLTMDTAGTSAKTSTAWLLRWRHMSSPQATKMPRPPSRRGTRSRPGPLRVRRGRRHDEERDDGGDEDPDDPPGEEQERQRVGPGPAGLPVLARAVLRLAGRGAVAVARVLMGPRVLCRAPLASRRPRPAARAADPALAAAGPGGGDRGRRGPRAGPGAGGRGGRPSPGGR